MYVGLTFSVPGVTFDLDSFGFEVLIRGSSAKHNAAPKKQSAKINPVVFIFMRPIESGSLFGSRLNACGDFAPGQNQNEPRQNNGWKEARYRKLRRERGQRRQDC
jgi:hypothetical protein